MEKVIKVGIHNRFDFVRRDAKTGEVLGEYKAENIILNNFWGIYISGASKYCLNYIHFGSGTATPVATDTKLTAWLGQKASIAVNTDFSTFFLDGVAKIKKTCRLEDSEFNGFFISEVGFSNNTSSNSGLLTKALVKDMNGNVVSIEKKAGEVLDIFATFYVKAGPTFDGGKIRVLANSAERIFFGKFFNDPVNIRYQQGKPQKQVYDYYGQTNNYETSSTITLDSANKKATFAIANVTAAKGNGIGGFRGILLGGLLQIDLPHTDFAQPVLTKEVVGTGNGSTKDFQTAFGYILDNGTAKVYVNDIEQSSGVTIDYNKPPRANLINDVIIVDWTKLQADGITPFFKTYALGNSGLNGQANAGFELIVENPKYASMPITSVKIANTSVYASNDLSNWVNVAEQATSTLTSKTIASEYQGYRYFKLVALANGAGVSEINTSATITNIHFDTAPTNGATVSMTYQPDVIAKDVNHVLNNVSVVLNFNEYTPT